MNLRTSLPILFASLAAIPLFGLRVNADPANRISDPVVHNNVAVFFIHGTSAPGPVPQTLQEALAKGTVEVQETGNVQELKIRNTGTEPVFVQFGDIVKGGQQDRVLTVSMQLEPNSGLVPIGAYCVESGRWAARGMEDSKKFALSESLMPSRAAKVAMARPVQRASEQAEAEVRRREEIAVQSNRQSLRGSLEQRSGYGGPSGQSEVWRSVDEVQQKLSAAIAAPVASEKSRTSLQLALEHEKLKDAQAAFLSVLEPAGMKDDDVLGVVIAVNGRVSSADIYPSNGLFKKMWPKLARAAATEGLSQTGQAPVEPPQPAQVSAFIAEAEAGKPSNRHIEGVVDQETREAEKSLRVEARSAKGAFLHRNYLAK